MLSLAKKRSNRSTSVQLAAVIVAALVIISMVSVGWVSALKSANNKVNEWWPVNGVTLTDQQPFKADLVGYPVDSYKLYWYVDNGAWNEMPSNYEHYPHKEVVVDVSSWNWQGSGSYAVTFVATDNRGKIIAKESLNVYTGNDTAVTITTESSQLAAQQTPKLSEVVESASVPVSTVISQGLNPISGEQLYVNPDSPAARQALEWQSTGRLGDATTMQRISDQPVMKWLGGWNVNVEAEVRDYTIAATNAGKVPSVVAYNIPQRDCGSHSAGGVASGEAYRNWIHSIARGIGSRTTVVVLEPDALSQLDCLSLADRSTRQNLIKDAVAILKRESGSIVYIDAGNARWHSADEMANRLKTVGIDAADGFSLNVSNFITTDENIKYGEGISQKLNGTHFVIDTSRNGAGPTEDSQWCNPRGRALGQVPSTVTSHPLVDAYVWAKAPGESDGACNGGPSAGTWWPEYALELAKNAQW